MSSQKKVAKKSFITKATSLVTSPGKVSRVIQDRVRHRAALAQEQRTMRQPKQSYSQAGEDLIIKFIFNTLKIDKPSYMDVGAHHPYFLNNTALLYESGSRGINIEPDSNLITAFEKERASDTNLNVGIAPEPGELKFYIVNPPILNTFSESEVAKYIERGYAVTEEKIIPVRTMTDVVNEYCGGKFPDLLTVDVEGMDFDLLKSINYKSSSPTVICVETVTPHKQAYRKVPEIEEFLLKQGYMVYADTFINTIFLKKSKWKNLY